MDTTYIWDKIQERLEAYSCYKHRASNGQKSGIHLIEEYNRYKFVLEIYFYDDTCIEAKNVMPKVTIEQMILDTQFEYIFETMFRQSWEELNKKQKEYNTYLKYTKLQEELEEKLTDKKGVKL